MRIRIGYVSDTGYAPSLAYRGNVGYNFLERAILNWIDRLGKFITDRAFIKHQATAFMHVFDQMSGHGNFSLTCLPDSHCYITGGPDCIEESESSAKL